MKRSVLLIFMVMMATSFELVAQENEKCMEELKVILTCKLTTPELQQHKKTVIADLKNRLLEKTETGNGFRYKFEGSDQMLDKLNAFIKTERQCCDFFMFTLTVSGDARFAWLEISGSPEAKQFIQSEMEF